MTKEPDVKVVLAQYLQRVVQGAKGNVVTFGPSTVVKMWGKWFGYDRVPENLVRKISRLLNELAQCGLLRKYSLYKYQLTKDSKLWNSAKNGTLLNFLKDFNCYIDESNKVQIRIYFL